MARSLPPEVQFHPERGTPARRDRNARRRVQPREGKEIGASIGTRGSVDQSTWSGPDSTLEPGLKNEPAAEDERVAAPAAPPRVSMQVSLAPTDLPHVQYTLPHQLRVWATQVAEVVLVVDLHRSPGRYGHAAPERLRGLRKVIASTCAEFAHVRTIDVDYSEEVAQTLAQKYAGGRPLPIKDCYGAPFYAYFFGLEAAANDVVFHLDSDMLYGGGSQIWMREAVQVLNTQPDVLTVSPLPGPPTRDGSLRSQTLERDPRPGLAFRAPALSTRHFIANRTRLRSYLPLAELLPPNKRRRLAAWMDGTPAFRPAEEHLSAAMAALGLVRLDFLGEGPGMWAVHPPYRSALFYQTLPSLIERIESGDVPDEQRGCHDLNDSMVDWTGARTTKVERMARHLQLAGQRAIRLLRERIGEVKRTSPP